MKFEEYRNPVLISGLIAGIVSSVPFIGWLNACCCLWILLGGLLSVYMTSSTTHKKITYGEGAIIGLFSGLVAAVISTIIDAILSVFGYSMIQSLVERFAKIEEFSDYISIDNLKISSIILDLLSSLLLFGAFGALGGIIGISIYGKKKEPETASQA